MLYTEVWQGMVLGVVQGLTEFFPVSSSGHLVIIPRWFGWPDQGLAFDTVLHLGTLLALIWFFRQDLKDLSRAVFSSKMEIRRAAWVLIGKVILASLPALVAGALFNRAIETWARRLDFVAMDLLVWGCILLAIDRYARVDGKTRLEQVTWTQALWVGMLQPIALLPGTSRSGITMTAGRWSGLSRALAARFSFFVSLPVTAAAGLHGVYELTRASGSFDHPAKLAAGFILSALVGAWAIRFLVSYVSQNPFSLFVAYRITLAACLLLSIWW